MQIFKLYKNYITIVNYIEASDKMEFELKFKDKTEKRELKSGYTIRNLLDELGLSAQTIVAKKNGELTIEEDEIADGDKIQLIQIIYGG